MLRFIDIVLILLFGFISISHFDRGVAVDLPRAANLPKLQAEFQEQALVSLTGDGVFVCGEDRQAASGAEQLRGWLAAEREAGVTQVRLRTDRMRPAADVALLQQICGELELGLTLEIVRETHEVRP